MASLAESLADLGPHRIERCPIPRLFGALDFADSAALHVAIDDGAIPAAALGRLLRNSEHLVSDEAIRRHRRGVCACARVAA